MPLTNHQNSVNSSDLPASARKTNDALHSASLAELELILKSSEFRQSEQCKRLLCYLVEHSLEGDEHLLKERAIGLALFNLEKGYDANAHPIVRIRMGEVRKRLAKYYYENPNAEIRFDVPAGGYRVEFKLAPANHVQATSADDSTPPIRSHLPWKYMLAGLLVVITAGAAFWLGFAKPPEVLTLFWQPALHSSAPVVICEGKSVVYRFTQGFRERVQGPSENHSPVVTGPLKLNPGDTIHANEVVPLVGRYVGFGSSDAIARIDAWLARQHKDSELRYGDDFSFIDLRKSPTVLVGAYTNAWTLQFTQGCRFTFETSGDTRVVRDGRSGKTWSPAHVAEDGQTDEDYLVISRLLQSESGEFLVTAAGITDYGTRSAGEILTNPALLAAALTVVKPGWEKHNLQMVFHVKVYRDTPGPPSLVALYQW